MPLVFPRTPEDLRAAAQQLGRTIEDRALAQLLKLTARTPAQAQAQAQVQTPTPKSTLEHSLGRILNDLPPTVQAYDRRARPLEVPRESLKQAVLEPALKQNASNPEALYRLLVRALEQGFIEESLPPAQHLVRIDPNTLRAASLLGFVLLQLRRFKETLEVLEPAVQAHGEDADVLVPIAKAYAGLGQTAKSEEILWRALTRDPNNKEGLEWYAALRAERDGKSGELTAYRRIAALPDSWLAQLWLAGAALEEQDVDGAMTLYKEVLRKLPDIPEEVLVRIGHDLVQRGALRQAVEFLEPRFDPLRHGLSLGAVLITAHLELNDPPAARHILEILYALQRPDWREHLTYWRKRIDEAHYGPLKQPRALGFELLRLANPIWAYGNPDFEALLPAKMPDPCRIVVVCGSASSEGSPPEALGRLTRFLPMFFAEELQLLTAAQSIFLLPWLSSGGVYLNTQPWKREQLELEGLNASFVLTMHAAARREPWELQFSLMAAADGFVVDEWSQSVDIENPAPTAMTALLRIKQTLSLLGRQAVPENLAAPGGAQLTSYLAAIEQALVVGVAQPERFIFNNLLRLAADTPHSARTRCLLVNTLDRVAVHRPDVVSAYWPKLQQLQDEHPLYTGSASVAVAAAVNSLEARLQR